MSDRARSKRKRKTAAAPTRRTGASLDGARRPGTAPPAAAVPAERVDPTAKALTSGRALGERAALRLAGVGRGGRAAGEPAVSAEAAYVDVARERASARLAGAAAVLTALLTLAAVPVAASGTPVGLSTRGDRGLLLTVAASGSSQVAAMWLRVASVALLAGFALFAYRATKGRNPAHPRYVPIIGLISVLVVAVSTAVGFYETRDVALRFAASADHSARAATHLLTLQRDRGPLRVADIGQVLGAVGFGIWVSLTSYEAMSVGLLTRFLGIFGIFSGIATAIGIALGPALFIAWIGSFGLLAIGYWPGGRPPAWDLGRAVSWLEVDPRTNTVIRGAGRRD